MNEYEIVKQDLENDTEIISVELMSNNLLKVTFNGVGPIYFHPDALSDLADEDEDEDNVVWPKDWYEDDEIDDTIGDKKEPLDIDLDTDIDTTPNLGPDL